MGDVKPWHIAIMVVAVVALCVSAYCSFRPRERVDLASTIVMADVTTGELFEYSVRGRRAVMVPGAHPETGKVVLLPAERDGNGRWVIRRRAMFALDEMEADPTAIDPETGEVQVSGRKPRRVP